MVGRSAEPPETCTRIEPRAGQSLGTRCCDRPPPARSASSSRAVVIVRAPALARQAAAAEVPRLRPRVVDAHVDLPDVVLAVLLCVGVVLLDLEEERRAVEEVGRAVGRRRRWRAVHGAKVPRGGVGAVLSSRFSVASWKRRSEMGFGLSGRGSRCLRWQTTSLAPSLAPRPGSPPGLPTRPRTSPKERRRETTRDDARAKRERRD